MSINVERCQSCLKTSIFYKIKTTNIHKILYKICFNFYRSVMRKECKSAVILFEDVDRELAEILAKYLDDNAQRIYDFFEIKPSKEKAKINIIPTKKAYDELYRAMYNLPVDYKVEKWKIGTCKDGEITYLSIHDYKNTSHKFDEEGFDKALLQYKKTILHEYVHFVNEKFNQIHGCTDTEKYLLEGIATYLSGQNEDVTLPLTLTKDEILDENNNYYNDYYLLTKYLVENYNKTVILQVLKNKSFARGVLENDLYDKAQEFYSRAEKTI